LRSTDYNDFPIPTDAQLVEVDELTALFSSPKFRKEEQEILGEVTFYTEIAYDVKRDFDF
jgi:hypothetical protein